MHKSKRTSEKPSKPKSFSEEPLTDSSAEFIVRRRGTTIRITSKDRRPLLDQFNRISSELRKAGCREYCEDNEEEWRRTERNLRALFFAMYEDYHVATVELRDEKKDRDLILITSMTAIESIATRVKSAVRS